MKTLSDLVTLDEGFTIELKRSQPSDLGREICAFANATGRVILLGVDDDGTVLGVEGHNRLKSRVQSIARSADPPISVEVESMGKVLSVRVPAQRGKPCSYGGQVLHSRRGVVAADGSGRDPRVLFRGGGDPRR